MACKDCKCFDHQRQCSLHGFHVSTINGLVNYTSSTTCYFSPSYFQLWRWPTHHPLGRHTDGLDKMLTY